MIASVVRVATASFRWWLPAFVTGYTVARFAVVAGELDDYGADPVVFGLLDIGTAWPYGYALAVLGQSLRARRWSRAVLVALASAPLAAAPYAYLLLGATGMPPALVAAICAVGIVSAAIGLWFVLYAPGGTRTHRARGGALRSAARSMRLSAPRLTTGRAFALWVLALSLKLGGSAWDVAYHFRYPFDAFSLAHATNVAGLLLVCGLALHNLRQLRAGRPAPLDAGALRLVIGGCGLFLLAAPLDQLSHVLFGVDLTTWSPTHLGLFAGTSLVILGVLLGLHRQVGRARVRILGGLALSAFLLEAVLFACSQQEYGAVTVYVLHHPAAAAAEGLVGPSAALVREARQYGSLEDMATGGLPAWLYPLFQLLAATCVLRLAQHAVPWRATATTVALLYVSYRTASRFVTDGAGLPVSFIPYHLVGVGLALDLARRTPAVAAAGAAAAVYGGVATLRLVDVGPPAPIGHAQALFLDGGIPIGIALAWAGIVAADALRRAAMTHDRGADTANIRLEPPRPTSPGMRSEEPAVGGPAVDDGVPAGVVGQRGCL